MKKSILIITIVLCSLLITGCGNEKIEGKFCSDIKPVIKEYRESKISYDEFYEGIREVHNKYCTDKQNDFCDNIENYIKDYDTWNSQEHDCTIYDENTSYGSSLKQACIDNNSIYENHIINKIDASVMDEECK